MLQIGLQSLHNLVYYHKIQALQIPQIKLYLFDLVDYSVTLKFVLANLKYSAKHHGSYFSIFHIVHRAYLDYTLINLYLLYFAVGGEHFTDTIIIRQIFLVSAHLYEFTFLLYYLLFYLSGFEH